MNPTDKNEKVSIIMAAYNAERTVGNAVRSVLAQTYTNYELIVIDDCSSDTTADIVSGFGDSRIRLIRHSRNMGVSLTRHEGATLATARLIAVLDSDDVWESDKLRLQIERMAETAADLVFTASTFMSCEGKPIPWTLHVPERISYRKLLKQNLISNSSVLVRRDLFIRYEVIDDNIHEDFACWLRMLNDGYTAVGIDLPLLHYRLSENSKSSNKWKAMAMNWRTYRAVKLGFFDAMHCMIWYIVNGLLKYHRLNRHKNRYDIQ